MGVGEGVETQQANQGESDLWNRFAVDPSSGAREELIDRYLPFARILAAKAYAKRASNEFEFDEYLQFASVGLIESIDRYDPRAGASFKTYSSYRITGAILSGLESLSEKQEQLTLMKRLRRERLETLKEAPAVGGGTDALFAKLADVALGLALGFMLDDCGLYRDQESIAPDTSYGALEMKELRQHIRNCVARLPDRERKLIVSHYFQQIPFDEIAIQMGISKGRVSQLHRRALDLVREEHSGRNGLDLAL